MSRSDGASTTVAKSAFICVMTVSYSALATVLGATWVGVEGTTASALVVGGKPRDSAVLAAILSG